METIRQEIISLLTESPLTARDISQAVGIREKEVYEHLFHIRKTVSAKKQKLVTIPSRCRSCGFEFKDRNKLTKPGKCPRCKSTYIDAPVFTIE